MLMRHRLRGKSESPQLPKVSPSTNKQFSSIYYRFDQIAPGATFTGQRGALTNLISLRKVSQTMAAVGDTDEFIYVAPNDHVYPEISQTIDHSGTFVFSDVVIGRRFQSKLSGDVYIKQNNGSAVHELNQRVLVVFSADHPISFPR